MNLARREDYTRRANIAMWDEYVRRGGPAHSEELLCCQESNMDGMEEIFLKILIWNWDKC